MLSLVRRGKGLVGRKANEGCLGAGRSEAAGCGDVGIGGVWMAARCAPVGRICNRILHGYSRSYTKLMQSYCPYYSSI